MKNPSARARIEVDTAALRHNFRFLRTRLHGGTKFCCVLKADGYGHGASPLARLFAEEGADFFALASAEEALSLRKEVATPLLVLGYTPPEYAPVLAANRIVQTVFSESYARALSACAVAASVRVAVHIKVDTGMHRLGFSHTDGAAILRVCRLPGLIPTGIFSHFATADCADGRDFFALQYRRFCRTVAELAEAGCVLPLRHMANSAAILAHPATQADMVRAGLALYGISPLATPVPALRPALRLFARAVQIRKIKAGEAVGYGADFVAKRPMRIATLPLGYADGIPRAAAEYGLGGETAEGFFPIVGRVCMDMCMLDVTGSRLREGEELLLLGGRGETSVARVAEKCGRIPYEILTSLGKRTPRIYRENS